MPTYPDFLLPGTICECDVDERCSNHDTAAEGDYWLSRFRIGVAA